ncbi:hypothetical protein [Humisphaera borealis]|uniref:Uncharacterized protein n=1 Tax=Humisphaera borealis TaxID=2807512 RepID=A0A7M2WZR4_9BACT|nr:hypothetical protein [Humisphaera borealis]QOV89970.1 hypothetical protein IPV69_00940 [Humisphaera borealis]
MPTEADQTQARSFVRRLLVGTGRLLLLVILLLVLAIGFGLSPGDQTKLSTFVDSVEQWQNNTEFRQVAAQYVTRGSDAMRSRPMGIRSADWIMWIRSLPVMPKEFAVNDTSKAHYENFSKGPLSAYLHLCTEVDLLNADGKGGYLGEFEGRFGRSSSPPSREDVRDWLKGLKWDYPVVYDEGAVQSLQSAIADVEPYRPLTKRARHIDDLLKPHIAVIAAGLKLPSTDVEHMTPLQQYAVLDRLDSHLRQTDPELWRTKQVSDVCGGIWGQVFSPPYLTLLTPYLQVATTCRWVAVGLLGLLLLLTARRLRQLSQGPVTLVSSDRPVSAEPA